MRTIACIFLLAVAQIASAQNWTNIQYKDLVSFSLPEGYTLLDTLGAQSYQSEIDDTTYICSFMADPEPMSFESEASIDAFYNDFFDRLVAKSDKPKVLKKEIVTIGKFRALSATLQRNVIVKQLHWQILTFHVKNMTVNFQCITQNAAPARFEKLRGSIRFNESLTTADQYKQAAAPAQNRNFMSKYGAYLLVGFAIVVGAGLMWKRKK